MSPLYDAIAAKQLKIKRKSENCELRFLNKLVAALVLDSDDEVDLFQARSLAHNDIYSSNLLSLIRSGKLLWRRG